MKIVDHHLGKLELHLKITGFFSFPNIVIHMYSTVIVENVLHLATVSGSRIWRFHIAEMKK